MTVSESGECPEKSDAELIAASAKGDDKAFRQLIQRYRVRILAICLRMLRNKTEAEEAAQDSFVKVYFHLKDVDPSRSFAAWAASVAMNECRDRLRSRARYSRLHRDLSETDGVTEPATGDPNEENKERLMEVEAALGELPENLKEVIVLKAYGGYSYEEIARILRIRQGTVMSRLFRAREKLAEIIKKGSSR